MDKNYPLITDVLEIYHQTSEGIPIFKTKGIELSLENLDEHLFILSTDISAYFKIRHDHLVERNVRKLQKSKYLTNHIPIFGEMVEIGSSAQRLRQVYALTQSQTEHLVADFTGEKAWVKKHTILSSLQAIRSEVRKGNYAKATEIAKKWDGIEVLKSMGFICSINGNMATKKDISTFLKIPLATLESSLRKYSNQVQSVKLDQEEIRKTGSKASRLNAYKLEDVLKISLWTDSETGLDLKKLLWGNIGTHFNPVPRSETEWKKVLREIFDGFGFYSNYPIQEYKVDFFVEKLALVLECDADSHRFYDQEYERQREQVILKKYALIRFPDKINIERLFNAILSIRPSQIIRLEKPVSKLQIN